MNILIDKIRIKNFRSLQDINVDLQPITVLVGTNNAGKTTFLRALNTVLGSGRTQLNKDDLFIDKDGKRSDESIIIDIRFVPIDLDSNRIDNFDDSWRSVLGGEEYIKQENGKGYFAFRSEFTFDKEDTPIPSYKLIEDWENEIVNNNFNRISQIRENIKMYFVDAQRDLQNDLKLRTSYFGKLSTQLDKDYRQEDLETLNELIAELNVTAISNSKVLTHLKEHLEKLNKTTSTNGAGISISPFPNKVRELHKGMNVYFQDNQSENFSIEYHGMGTRSWASILTVGAYTDWITKEIAKKIANGEETGLLFPILALEEPEAHLHPNAQRTLYGQLKSFRGQKIVSTHSPYIAGQAGLQELRHFYKKEDRVEVTMIDISLLNIKAINRIKDNINSSKGEVLFAKVVIMSEGETEGIMLPILAKTYFNKSDFELGINFTVTGKHFSLLTLLRFLKIEWLIFSDYDKPDVKSALKDILRNNGISDSSPNIIKLNDDNTQKCIEEYLFDEGYDIEMRMALKSIRKPVYRNPQHEQAKKAEEEEENNRIDALSKQDFLKELESWKTKAAAIYSELILQRVNEAERFPPKIKELFDKIKAKLNL